MAEEIFEMQKNDDSMPKNKVDATEAVTLAIKMGFASVSVGELANKILRSELVEGHASDQEILDMQTASYSKKVFGLQCPLLKKPSTGKTERHYYKEPLKIRNKQTGAAETYLLCNEWYETPSNNDRALLESWLGAHS